MNVSTVNNNLQTLATMATIAAVRSRPVARRRPVYLKDLGDFFTELREQRGWNQSEAADMAQRRGLLPLTRQVLLRLERGQTKNPEPEVMRAVAALYGMDYGEVVGRFIGVRFGVTSSVISNDQGSASLGGAPDVPASARARIQELETELESFKARWSDVQDVARSLFRIAVTGEEGRAASPRQASRRRSPRKTG